MSTAIKTTHIKPVGYHALMCRKISLFNKIAQLCQILKPLKKRHKRSIYCSYNTVKGLNNVYVPSHLKCQSDTKLMYYV